MPQTFTKLFQNSKQLLIYLWGTIHEIVFSSPLQSIFCRDIFRTSPDPSSPFPIPVVAQSLLCLDQIEDCHQR